MEEAKVIVKKKKSSKVKLFIAVSFCLLLVFILATAQGEVVNLQDWLQIEIVSPIESNGGIPVNIQDQTSPPFDLFFIQSLGNPATLQEDSFIDDLTLNLTSTTNFVDGTYVGLFSPGNDRFFFAEQQGAPSGNVITIDTPLDFNYTAGSLVLPFTRDINVDGSLTPQTFVVAGAGSASELELDITRIMISMETDSAVSLAEFGDLPALTNGLVLRRVDGETRNVWNVKSNGEIANLCYDYTPYLSTNPAQGQDGALFRYTFSGQDKHGVAVRLSPGDTLELIIQDDLSDLGQFRIIAEGHIVTD